MKTPCPVGLERPLFGQVARQVAGLRSEEVEACLQQQSSAGGRLGEIFLRRGLLNREQINQIMQYSARWVARAAQADLAPRSFPYPGFLSLCLPAYNEEANIEDTLDAACAVLPPFVQNFEIVVVDDGSRDGTGKAVAAYAEREPRVRLVRHEQNRGYGAAVASGLRSARGDLIAFTDSDGQFSLLDLPQLLTHLDGYDAVIGFRYRRADSLIRLLNAWGWNWLVRVVLGVWVRDLDCAFKLFRREVVDHLRMTATGASINAELLVQCVHRGLKISEAPVMHYPRYHGAATGAALRVIVRAFRELPRLVRYRFDTSHQVDSNLNSHLPMPVPNPSATGTLPD